MRGQAGDSSGGALNREKGKKGLARVLWQFTRPGILVLSHAYSYL